MTMPPLTAEQQAPCPGPTLRPGETYKGALARTGGQLVACGAGKADVVASYDGVRRAFTREAAR